MSTLAARFYAKADIANGTDGCWEWKGNVDEYGYGRISVDCTKYYAHRLSWIVNRGEIPAGMSVLHRCDNPICVNPAHLFLGTQLDNLKDMRTKGRGNSRPPKLKGSQVGTSRLDEAKALEIRALFKGGMRRNDIAAKFGIGRTTVRSVINRTSWTHI